MRKQLLAAVILMGGLSSVSYAMTQATGSVLFNFNITPDNISYNYAQGFFGYVDGVEAFFDNDYSTGLNVGLSSVYANWDSTTGDATEYGLTATSSGGELSRASINYAIAFTVTTDVLSFSYQYDFLGLRTGTVDGNSLSMGIQAEISSDNEVFYTDYSSSHPTFQTNWAYFELEQGTQTALDVAGMINHEFGEPGLFRTWYIQLDVLASGRDTVGAVPLPASLPLLLGALAMLATIGRRRDF